MKRSAFAVITVCSMLLISGSLCYAQARPDPKLPAKTPAHIAAATWDMNIQDLANSQIYRYGREMFLAGNYPEAAKVFLEMLRVDCHSKAARYHLEKIADIAPRLGFLREKLKNTSCGAQDFKKEDYLPASAYYKDDPALLLDLLLASHKRNRLNEQDMKEQLAHYTALTSDLEATLKVLKEAGFGGTSASPSRAIAERLEKSRALAVQIEKEVVLLKNQLASERLQRQKEVQDLRTRVSEAEVQSTRDIPDAPVAGTGPRSYSPAALELINATAKAKAQLQDKETELTATEKSSDVLQSRLNDLEGRLKAVQSNLHGTRQP